VEAACGGRFSAVMYASVHMAQLSVMDFEAHMLGWSGLGASWRAIRKLITQSREHMGAILDRMAVTKRVIKNAMNQLGALPVSTEGTTD